jgi:hypothetical protein
MHIEVLTPAGALVGLSALLPLLSWLWRRRADARARAALGLEPPRLGVQSLTLLPCLGVVALLAAAAAQPVLQRDGVLKGRADAEAYIVLDTSKSMLAAGGLRTDTRFERARDLALRIRTAMPSIPMGLASFTDRPLPHLLPTPDQKAFAAVLRQSIGVDRPPPAARRPRATDLTALAQLATLNWFRPTTTHRLAIVLTDGETEPVRVPLLMRALATSHVRLLLVRVARRGEWVYLANGRRDRGYRPPAAIDLRGLTIFDERDVRSLVRRIRSDVGSGQLVGSGTVSRRTPLAPYLAVAALAPLVWLLVVCRVDARRVASARAAQAALRRLRRPFAGSTA